MLRKGLPEMFKNCNRGAMPRSGGISPEILLLLRSKKVRFWRWPKPAGMEPVRRLSSIRMRHNEEQRVREEGI
ncbi:hypothetical protein IEQ34_016519 [Dendrobium chrysotoxum]|uniref:Uncharacterized protein n=1 Tax=Dendrobium chrysotoxum TaxID=161865 RepID=A0AAV7GFS9_DENCH|nr:hypothetical protein IEQ34_016519 [Dendrobium chrysotoxum]